LGVDIFAAITSGRRAARTRRREGDIDQGSVARQDRRHERPVDPRRHHELGAHAGFLSDLKISAPNLSQLTHAVQQNIAKQRQAAASTSAPAVAPASHPVQLSPAHTWLWLGIGGAGLFLILRQLERRAA
jgi:hypothetical protein